MTDLTLEDRLSGLEARLAELERRLPSLVTGAASTEGFGDREQLDTWWESVTQGRKPIDARAVRQMQIDRERIRGQV